MSVFTTVSW